jgi:SNF2 family DNA or RNA helicase
MPGALGSRAQFERELATHESPAAGARWLASRIRPFVLRRTKAQVATDLPPKIEKDIVCEMSGLQQTLYRAELKKAQQQLLLVENERQFQHERFHILASLMRLRQICCDPALAFPGTRASSAKFEAMDDLLDPILAEGHKVLIFSQFTTLLRTARKRVAAQGAPVFVLTGKTESRGAVVSRFNETLGPAVFLISLKAGGSGLNLASASYVILLDPWWNPAAEAQAIDRAHRIGQTRTVIAYRLLIKESIEEKIQALQATKSTLAGAVLGDQSFATAINLAGWRALLAQ